MKPELVEHHCLHPASGLVSLDGEARLPTVADATSPLPPPPPPPRTAEEQLALLHRELPAAVVEQLVARLGDLQGHCENVMRADEARQRAAAHSGEAARSRTAFEFFQLLLMEELVEASPSRKDAKLALLRQWNAAKGVTDATFQWCKLLEAEDAARHRDGAAY